MGYEVHICRTRNWQDSANQPIGQKEIHELVEVFPGLKLLDDGQIEVASGFSLSYDGTKLTLKSPTDAQMVVACQISQKLEALLIGDDQEWYVLKKKHFNLFGPYVLKTMSE